MSIKTGDNIRCFFAIELPGFIKDRLSGMQKNIKRGGVKLVERGNLHITLKFIGEIEKDNVKLISGRVEDHVKHVKGFPVEVKGAGFFPPEGRIRTIWVGISEGESDIKKLSGIIHKCSREFGRSSGSPHITLGRVRGRVNIREEVLNMRGKGIGNFTVNHISMKKSVLTREGPVYSNVKVFSLGGG